MKNLIEVGKKWFFKIGIGLIIISLIGTTLYLNNEKKKVENNIIALSDSLEISKNKLNEEIKSKKLLVMDISKLKEINSDLVYEINKLSNKDKKNLIEINKLKFNIDMLKDSILKLQSGKVIIINDSTKVYPFEFPKNKFRELKWDVTVIDRQYLPNIVTSSLLVDKFYSDLIINHIKDGENIKLSVSSSNPYLTITDIKGSIINTKAYNQYQKPKPFGLGVHIGYGLSTNNGIVYLSPYIGVGLSYNFIRF